MNPNRGWVNNGGGAGATSGNVGNTRGAYSAPISATSAIFRRSVDLTGHTNRLDPVRQT